MEGSEQKSLDVVPQQHVVFSGRKLEAGQMIRHEIQLRWNEGWEEMDLQFVKIPQQVAEGPPRSPGAGFLPSQPADDVLVV